jgi:hypothetical protein
MTISAHGKPYILTPNQTATVKSELDAILHSSQFSGSSRCSELLAYVVNNALAGDFENLTERILGAQLYGRPLDYETGSDSIVRVRANDVRRRLTEYYSEHQPNFGVRIVLRSGSYIPELHWSAPETPSEPGEAADAGPSLADGEAENPPLTSSLRAGAVRRSLRIPVLAAAVLLLTVVVPAILWLHRAPPPDDALKRFWEPLLDQNNPVIVCFGNTTLFWPSATVRQAIEKGDQRLTIGPQAFTKTTDDFALEGDLLSALSILNLMDRHGITAELRWPDEIETAELNKSNVVFIGAFNNPWSMSLNSGLRFSFKQIQSESRTVWKIQDRASPNEDWSITTNYPQQMSTDYAIITRIFDREGKRIEISVGGIGEFGTQAAGEFLADESQMAAFARSAPKDWEHRNLQIVLGMGVDGRKIVNPRILATNVW